MNAGSLTNITAETVHSQLKRLKLASLSSNLEEILSTASAAKMTPLEVLNYALSFEVRCREEKRVRLGMTIAHFPRVCTLEGFDLEHSQTSLTEKTIRDLARLDWLREKKNIVFLGPPGVGKTHLSIALGRLAIEQGFTTSFFSATGLMSLLEKADAEGHLEEEIAQLMKPKLLIIDELGYLPIRTASAHLFFQLVSAKYENSSIIVSSNRSLTEWGTVFNDSVAAAAIMDRLLHHSEVIPIRGESYRLLEKRRAGLFGGPRSKSQ